MSRFHILLVAAIYFAPNAVGQARLIDDYSTGTFVVNGPGQLEQSGLDPQLVIGGTRRMDVGQYGVGSKLEVTDAGRLRLSSTGWGYFELTYGAVAPLGGIDLTASGHDRLLVRFGDVGPGFHPFGIYVSLPSNSSSNGQSMYVRDSWDGMLVEIPYSNFPVSFAAVDSITLDGFRNPGGSWFEIDSIATGKASSAGDFNRDGVVDAADLNEWFLAVGNSGTSGSNGARFTADGDQDGDVDGADLLAWQRSFALDPSSSTAGVPEPATAVLVIACVFAVTSHTRRPWATGSGG